MTTDSLTGGSKTERASAFTLIELQSSCSWKPKGYWRVYLYAILYGIIAGLLGGAEFFILYCCVLVVVFVLDDFNEKRTQRQIGLLMQLVQELEKEK